jgi:nuclear mRNA export protein PCID2/THP1
MATPTIDLFLNYLRKFLSSKNGASIADYLRVEPPVGQIYYKLKAEVQASFPKGSEARLDSRVNTALPESDVFDPEGKEGQPWPGFIDFVKGYLEFWRDVDYQNLVQTHQMLTSLVK